MKRIFLFLFVALCLTPPAKAEEPSLFLTPDEQATLSQTPRETRPLTKNTRARDSVTLKAILYLGPAQWVFWLGDQKWTPLTTDKIFQVVSVTPNNVTLSRLDGKGSGKAITLLPHQTYFWATDKIEEGRAP